MVSGIPDQSVTVGGQVSECRVREDLLTAGGARRGMPAMASMINGTFVSAS